MPSSVLTRDEALSRLVKRADYVSCNVAFIDCKKPGSHLKENYSIIGPGVTSSSDQVINLPERHGFNIGAAAMPNGITNNLHVHFTAEVFLCFAGEWTFRWGPKGEDGEIVGEPGDIVSVPTWIFRGFTNTGADDGWLFTCLGGDDTGGVIWHPDIIREAARYGLYISAANTLIDTDRGDPMPDEDGLIQPMSDEDVAALRRYTAEEMDRRVVAAATLDWRPAFIDRQLDGCGAEMAPVIGAGITQNRDHAARILDPHGFSLEWLRLAPGQRVSRFQLDEKMVLISYEGSVEVVLNVVGPVTVRIDERDTYSIPAGAWREIVNHGDEPARLVVIVSGDHRKRPEFAPAVIEAAQAAGSVLDPGGYTVASHLLPRYTHPQT